MSKLLEIKSCQECPHRKSERTWTADSFETEFKWECMLSNKIIDPLVSWNEFDKIKIPNWCEL